MKKFFFITGGGTGGHIYPAIAVADGLLENRIAQEIFYVGNPDNLEYSIVKNKKSYIFLPVKSSGMPRKACFSFISWGFQMFLAFIKCCYYVLKYKPDVIFGTGGYVSAPILIAGAIMGIPFVMHDCDANPGLVTRKLAPFAKSISVAFDIEKNKLNNNNCYVNGNPIRKEFYTLKKEEARNILGLENKITLCVTGGSQGAKKINGAICEILKDLSQNLNIQILFQTGKRNYDEVIQKLCEIYPNYNNDKNIIVKPYFENMVKVLKSSDISISRAGSLSISEICASSVASIFVPYPYAAADHQRVNARYMADCEAGIYLENDEVTGTKLYAMIEDLVQNSKKLEKLQQNAFKLAKFDGVKNIIGQIADNV